MKWTVLNSSPVRRSFQWNTHKWVLSKSRQELMRQTHCNKIWKGQHFSWLCNTLQAIRGNFKQPLTCIIVFPQQQIIFCIIDGWMNGRTSGWLFVWVSMIYFSETQELREFNLTFILQQEDFLLFSHITLQKHDASYCFCNTCCSERLLTWPASMLLHFKELRLFTLVLFNLKLTVAVQCLQSKRSVWGIIFQLLCCVTTMRQGIKWVHKIPESHTAFD